MSVFRGFPYSRLARSPQPGPANGLSPASPYRYRFEDPHDRPALALIDPLAVVAALPAASPVVDRGGRDGGAVSVKAAGDLSLKPTAPKVRGVRSATQVWMGG